MRENIDKLDDRKARLFAADCAERVIGIVEKAYPHNDSATTAISVARTFAEDPELWIKRDQAWDDVKAVCMSLKGEAWAAAVSASYAVARLPARNCAINASQYAVKARNPSEQEAELQWQADRLKHY